MNSLTRAAIVVLLISAGGTIWGFQYRSDHPISAIGAFLGAADSTYALAGWAYGLGILGFLIGVALLIGGLSRTSASTARSD